MFSDLVGDAAVQAFSHSCYVGVVLCLWHHSTSSITIASGNLFII